MKLPEQVVLERDIMMYELRKRGLSYEQIGKAMQISSSTAHKGVARMTERILKRMSTDRAAQAALDLERLDSLLANVWDLTRKRKIEGPGGEEIELPPSFEAIDRALKIMDRRAKLLGLDNNVIDVNITGGLQAAIPGGEKEDALSERTARDEAIELMKVMRNAGVLDDELTARILAGVDETKELEAPDGDDEEIIEPEMLELEPPSWEETDDSEVWDG